jgi:hypothetical protein
MMKGPMIARESLCQWVLVTVSEKGSGRRQSPALQMAPQILTELVTLLEVKKV